MTWFKVQAQSADMLCMNDKIYRFASLVEAHQIERLRDTGIDCQGNIDNSRTRVVPGKKYTKVNIGSSGRYMVELSTGNIFGVKGYGVIHRGHPYGTLDTISDYYWGYYYPYLKSGECVMNKY